MSRLRKVVSILICLSLITAIALVPSTATAVPQQPMRFSGDVTIAGAAAPDGIDVSAKIDGITYSRTTTFTSAGGAGRYGDTPNLFYVPADDSDTASKEGGVNGDQVDFYVGDQPITSVTFQIGSVVYTNPATELDLAVVGALPAAGAPTNLVQYTPINIDPPTFKWSAPLSIPGSVQYYEVKLNDGSWTAVGIPTDLEYEWVGAVGDGVDQTLQVRAVDLFDLAGAAAILNFSIDTTAVGQPGVPVQDTLENDNTPTFTWSVAAQADYYEVKMNGDAWIDVADVLTYTHSTALADGLHTFRVRAKDAAGNAGPEAVLTDFTVDVTLPTKPTDLTKDSGDNVTKPTFSWTSSTDATSGLDPYEYKIDDGSWTSTSSIAATYTHDTDLGYGTHIFYIRAKDGAGNLSAVANILFTLTSTVASTPIVVSRTTPDNDSTPTITWDDVLGVDDYEVQLDATTPGSWIALGDVTVYTYPTVIADGTHTFYVQEVGSFGTTAGNTSFFIDGTGPTTPTNLSRATAANNNTPSFTWTHSTDDRTDVDTYEIRLDAGEWSDIGYVNTYAYATAISDGSHVVYVRAKDGAGNYSTVATVAFSIETADPVIAVASPNGSEVLKGGVAATIMWTTTDTNRGTVKIEYSTNSGAGWMTIEASTADTGSYAWSVPALNVNTAQVRITATDQAGNTGSDTSGADFTIDSSAPVASGIGTQNITQTGAIVVWTTDEAATTQVEYGLDISYGSTTTQVTTLSTDHSVTLSGLAPGTTYHYRVRSQDKAGNEVISADGSFAAQTASVVITSSDIGETNVTSYSATISWTTSVGTSGQVEYGATAAYGSTTAVYNAQTGVTSHSVSLNNLLPNTEYHYRVISSNISGGAVSADNTFTTAADSTAPTVSGVASAGVTVSTASIGWNTNEISTSQVVYDTSTYAAGSKGDYAQTTALDSSLELGHGVGLSGLTAGTTYYYRVLSKDGANNEAVSEESSFATLADTTGPMVSGIAQSSITTSSASVSWLTNEMATTQVFYDTASHVAGVPGDYTSSTALIASLTYGHSATIAGLTPGTTYFYRVVSKDASDNETASAEGSFDTQADVTDPIISGVTEANVSSANAIILWLTNEDATSKVVYDITSRSTAGAYLVSTAVDATADNTSHGVVLTGLFDATTYYYRVVSKDASDNEAVSAEYSFTTGDATPPAISDIESVAISDTATGIVWITDEGATTQVVYSTTSHSGETYTDAAAARTAYGSFSAEDAALRDGHGVVLTSLSSGVTYYYRVISRDGSNNETISAEYSFTTT